MVTHGAILSQIVPNGAHPVIFFTGTLHASSITFDDVEITVDMWEIFWARGLNGCTVFGDDIPKSKICRNCLNHNNFCLLCSVVYASRHTCEPNPAVQKTQSQQGEWRKLDWELIERKVHGITTVMTTLSQYIYKKAHIKSAGKYILAISLDIPTKLILWWLINQACFPGCTQTFPC